MANSWCCPLLVASLLVAGVAQAADESKQNANNDKVQEATVPASGMRIYIDPATGQWSDRPVTEEQKQQAAAQVDTFDPSKIETIQHADGSTEYRTNGQMVDTLVAKIGSDGKLHMVCSQHGLDHLIESTTAPSQGGPDVR